MHKVVMPYFHTLIMKIDTLLKRHLTKENLIIMALWKSFLTFLRCICNFIWRNLCSDIISANFSPSDCYVLTSDFPLTMHSSRSLSMESQVMRWKAERKIKNEFCLHHLERHRRLPPLVSYQKPVLCHRKMRW